MAKMLLLIRASGRKIPVFSCLLQLVCSGARVKSEAYLLTFLMPRGEVNTKVRILTTPMRCVALREQEHAANWHLKIFPLENEIFHSIFIQVSLHFPSVFLAVERLNTEQKGRTSYHKISNTSTSHASTKRMASGVKTMQNYNRWLLWTKTDVYFQEAATAWEFYVAKLFGISCSSHLSLAVLKEDAH